MLRTAALNLYRRWIRRGARPWSAEELRRSAVVFSPHFDDETLGCGGTILQKRRAGAAVSLVFFAAMDETCAVERRSSLSRRLRRRNESAVHLLIWRSQAPSFAGSLS